MRASSFAPAIAVIMAFSAIPARGAAIVMGPYLQNVTTGAVTIIWWTDFAPLDSWVEYGSGLTQRQTAVRSEAACFSAYPYRYKQEARITGLMPGQTYDYLVRSSPGGRPVASDTYTFRTDPGRRAHVHFAHMGDGQLTTFSVIARNKAVFAGALAAGADFILHAGDLLSDSMARFKAVCAHPGNGSENPEWEERYYGHDHLVERCVTGPAGFHTNYPGGLGVPETWQDERNLNYLVNGNGGNTSRDAQSGWQTWMDITDNNGPPYYTAHFYDWANTNEYASFRDVDIARNRTNDRWRATFKVVRIEPGGGTAVFDEFFIERDDPGPPVATHAVEIVTDPPGLSLAVGRGVRSGALERGLGGRDARAGDGRRGGLLPLRGVDRRPAGGADE
jgi:hypothetical protein